MKGDTIMANIKVDWDTERLEELLGKDIGEIREMLAYEDANDTFEDFLTNNGWIDGVSYEDDEDDEDYADPDDEDEDEDYDNDDWDDDEDDYDDEDEVETPSNLSSEEEALAQSIASDIDDCKYSIDAIRGLYDSRIIERIEYLID